MRLLKLSSGRAKGWLGLGAVLVMVMIITGSVFAQTSGSVFFPIAAGFVDVIPHQIVRTADDRVYIFAAKAQYTANLVAYWTTAAGLPNTGAFTGTRQITLPANVLSVEAAYDGVNTIHVITNTNNGAVSDYPFDIPTNNFKAAIVLSSANPSVPSGDYMGTSGVSAMFDTGGKLHIAYWSNGNHVSHQVYTYNASANTLTAGGTATTLDSAGAANHPALAVSPADGSVTVAWVSKAASPARIIARTRSSAGVWGSEETVTSAPVWTSSNGGINIDQGPSLAIGKDGMKHLTYIEDFDSTNQYGRVHYVSKTGSGAWVDQALTTYSHDPAVALNNLNEVYIIGHGPTQTNQNNNLYWIKKNTNNTWTGLQLFASPKSGDSMDASVSVKWSVVGWNRSDTIEAAFFAATAGNYNNSVLYYGRIGGASAAPTATPIPPTLTPTKTSVPPSATATKTPVPATATNTPVPPTQTPPTGAALRLDVSPGSASIGGQVVVSLNLFNVANVYGLQTQCQVDPNLLTGINRTDGDGFNQTNSFFVDGGYKADGSWLIAASRLQPNPALSGNILAFKLNYTAKNVGNAAIACTVLAVDTNGKDLPVSVINSSVNITAGVTATPVVVSPTTVPPTNTPTVVPATLTPTVAAPTATPTTVIGGQQLPTYTPTPGTGTVTPTAGAPSLVKGVASYQNRPDNSGIKVELKAGQNTLATLTTNANGAYQFTDVPVGSYTVVLSAPQNLAVTYTVQVTQAGSTLDLGAGKLPAGDTDDNQKIELKDAAFVGANFGIQVPPAPANADFNGDKVVNIRDLAIVGGNYGVNGPVAGQ